MLAQSAATPPSASSRSNSTHGRRNAECTQQETAPMGDETFSSGLRASEAVTSIAGWSGSLGSKPACFLILAIATAKRNQQDCGRRKKKASRRRVTRLS
eukprot:scaffold76699_cov51-Phaeocystis_antarctica.AAC.1